MNSVTDSFSDAPANGMGEIASLVLCSLCMACLLLASCNSSDTTPQLISASFQDLNRDGIPQREEQILLKFDRAISLTQKQSKGGILLTHADGQVGSLGAYKVSSMLSRGGNERELLVELGGGNLNFEYRGLYPHKAASGISVNFSSLDCMDSQGRKLEGQSQVVDLALAAQAVTRLIQADWVDIDLDRSLNEGDEVHLRFDGNVRLSPQAKAKKDEALQELLLPLAGNDRFDNGQISSSLREDADPRQVVIRLGSSPSLDVRDYADSADEGTKIGVAGTPLIPNEYVWDHSDYGRGVCGAEALFLSTQELSPFEEIDLPTAIEEQLDLNNNEYVQNVTPLSGDRLLISGPQEKVFMRHADGSFSQAFSCTLKGRLCRWQWHSATHFPAQMNNGLDECVLLVGGFNQEAGEMQSQAAFFFPNSDPPQLLAVDLPLSRRCYHMAHAIPGRGSLVVVGGLRSIKELNAHVEELWFKVQYSPEKGYSVDAQVVNLGKLRYGRWHSDSVLTKLGDKWAIFLFGGEGSIASERTVDIENRRILAAPELFFIEAYDGIHSLELSSSTLELARRRGHSLVPLGEFAKDPSFLLVGGASKSEDLGFSLLNQQDSIDDSRSAYQLRLRQIEIERPGQQSSMRISLEVEKMGELAVGRENASCITLPSGKILIAGGREFDGTVSRKVELYDPELRAFSSLAYDLPTPRSGFQLAYWHQSEGIYYAVFGGLRDLEFNEDSRIGELFRFQDD